jgi:Flp pilus assembly protein TadB
VRAKREERRQERLRRREEERKAREEVQRQLWMRKTEEKRRQTMERNAEVFFHLSSVGVLQIAFVAVALHKLVFCETYCFS